MAEMVADTNATVLITGESGTGKELIAELIRERSGRRGQPYVAVNCGAIPESLQESEFFGHVRGAFTGAVERKIGKFERADGGTIFLDEISEMTPSLQVGLLRTLQTGEYSPVGSSKSQHCDVRIIAAANCDLAESLAQGTFRSDLYYRLNIIRLEMPPLRERLTDIPALASHFAKLFGERCGKPGLMVSPEALRLLSSYTYPGNVRELENFIRRAAILCAGHSIRPPHLPPEIARATPAGVEPDGELEDFQTAKTRVIEQFERAYVATALTRCGGIISRAADYAGLSERNLHEKIKRYGIDAKGFRAPSRRKNPLMA
jgi:DNA-binding NtrC family response regulator